MSVTITPSANTALDTDIVLSGTVTISGALADNSETLNVSIYYNNNGATYIGIPQVYDGTSTVTYNYPNGTVLTVNYSTGAWTFQRLTTEIGSTEYEYVITFTFKGSSTVSGAVTVKPTRNITITTLSADTLDDLDNNVTGSIDVSISDLTSQKIRVDVAKGTTSLVGTEQNITSLSSSYTFNYSDGTKMVVNLGTNTWTYTRKQTDVGDSASDIYDFSFRIGNLNQAIRVESYVGYPPNITKFVVNNTLDTDAKANGVLLADNLATSTLKIDVTHNNIQMVGTQETYVANSSLTWTYSDGSTLTLNTSTNEWEYTRIQTDCTDLREDFYEFALSIASRYGTDTASTSVTTTIPSAVILGFNAENITDTEPTIEGELKYTLPAVANTPTMQVDVTSNGTEYAGIPIDLSSALSIRFVYSDGSRFDVDPTEGTFTFTRSSDDAEIIANDTYVFKCTIIVNGQVTTQSLTVKSYAGVRHYDYQPAYPVNFYAGSPEAGNTAWPKYIEEIKRVYRLYNENMNNYESMLRGLDSKFDALEKTINDVINNLLSGLAANLDGIILPYVGDLDKIPDGWYLCDGTNGTPNLMDGKFLEGSNNIKQTINAGLPNITGWTNSALDVWGSSSGAFYRSSSGQVGTSGSDTDNQALGFDASRSNSIYGKSNTVQPYAYTVYWIMKVADEV